MCGILTNILLLYIQGYKYKYTSTLHRKILQRITNLLREGCPLPRHDVLQLDDRYKSRLADVRGDENPRAGEVRAAPHRILPPDGLDRAGVREEFTSKRSPMSSQKSPVYFKNEPCSPVYYRREPASSQESLYTSRKSSMPSRKSPVCCIKRALHHFHLLQRDRARQEPRIPDKRALHHDKRALSRACNETVPAKSPCAEKSPAKRTRLFWDKRALHHV